MRGAGAGAETADVNRLSRRIPMTAEQNATLVRRGYEAFNSGDLATLAELVREDVVFYQPGSSEVAGEHRGRHEVFGYCGRLAQHSEGTFRAEIEELYASDRHAVVVHHATGRRNGSALDTRT